MGEYVFIWGKMKTKKLSEVLEKNPDYVKYLMTIEADPKTSLGKFQKYVTDKKLI